MLWQESSRFEVLVLKHNKGRCLLAVILLKLKEIYQKTFPIREVCHADHFEVESRS